MRVAIHQPNYFPWLGYFYKIWSADVFIFLDDVQYTKNSYINRAQIQNGRENRWVTIPVSFRLGDSIHEVKPAKDNWPCSHVDLLFNIYRDAACFKMVMPIVEEIILSTPQGHLSEINRHIILKIAELLEIDRQYVLSSDIGVFAESAEDRLIKLTRSVAPDAVYLSGKGGAKYQNEEKYEEAGLGFEYINFTHPVYDQGGEPFVPGRSILDAFFHLGVQGTKNLLIGAEGSAKGNND